MATKLGKVVTYREEFPLIKLLDPSGFVSSCDILNTLYLHLHLTNCHQTWQGDREKLPWTVRNFHL